MKQVPPWDGDRLGEVLRGSRTPLANRMVQVGLNRCVSKKVVTLITGRDRRESAKGRVQRQSL